MAFALWLLLSPGRVVSREMTWDMLFPLTGGWRVLQGQIPHVDFHDPAGSLNFLLAAAGFHLVGVRPYAFLAASSIFALAIFICACLAAAPRLPLLAATMFVVFACLLVLMPANAGDLPSAYSFAMSYNRYGWSALSVVALILFLPTRAGDDGGIVAKAVVAVLLLAMFHLKVTYFAAGMAALGLAILICPAMRARWQAWMAIGALLTVNALAPYSFPYLADLFANVGSGAVKSNFVLFLNYFLSNGTEHAVAVALVGLAVWLWLRGIAPVHVPLAAAFLVVSGWLLLSQNIQFNGVPLPVVVALLLYQTLLSREFENPRTYQALGGLPVLLLIMPAIWIIMSGASVVGHYFKAHDPSWTVVDRTNLRGLEVPTEKPGLLAAFAKGDIVPQLLSWARVDRPRHELSSYEYIQTVLEAATILSKYPRGRVVLLDEVNPIPFILGWPSPHGGNLWSGPHEPQQPAEQLLGDADYVLVPKFSTMGAWTQEAASKIYGSYLTSHFHELQDSQSWLLLGRER
ncbi:MAG TPA: hypothetical protein VFB13_09705 [Reyranella sp.]|nr:hypothetical protein [Reyranella sp.]